MTYLGLVVVWNNKKDKGIKGLKMWILAMSLNFQNNNNSADNDWLQYAKNTYC